jgi:predicted Zn finger-like uncharacterized protein
MPITVECPACHAKLKVPDDAAGKRGRCPSCKTRIDVPSGAPDVFDIADDVSDDSASGPPGSPVAGVAPSSNGGSAAAFWAAAGPQPVVAAVPIDPNYAAMVTREPQVVVDRPVKDQPARVVVVDFDMPLWRMVIFMVKWAIAAIPAAIILMIIGLIAMMIWFAILGVLFSR